jgi:AbrB family looped-hinge helix DNA binding protein
VKTVVSTKGQIVLPAEIREVDAIEPGQEFEIERIERGQYRLVRLTPQPNEGLVDWLMSSSVASPYLVEHGFSLRDMRASQSGPSGKLLSPRSWRPSTLLCRAQHRHLVAKRS